MIMYLGLKKEICRLYPSVSCKMDLPSTSWYTHHVVTIVVPVIFFIHVLFTHVPEMNRLHSSMFLLRHNFFRGISERHFLLHSINRVLCDLLCGTKMTVSKIHFTTVCNKLITSQSCDWVEPNTVNPNFAFMPTGEHTEQKITCDHILNQSLARRSPMLFSLWKSFASH